MTELDSKSFTENQNPRPRRRLRVAIAVIGVAAAIGCGMLLFKLVAPSDEPEPPTSFAPLPPGQVELSGNVGFFGTKKNPKLCLAVLRRKFAPLECAELSLPENFSWRSVKYKETKYNDAETIRWTEEQAYTVYGYYTPSQGGGLGSFTFTRAVQSAPPGAQDPEKERKPFCQPVRAANPGNTTEEDRQRFWEATLELPVVEMRTVGDSNEEGFSLMVQGDAQAVLAKLRPLWSGGLCVVSSNAPTESQREDAILRAREAHPDGQLITASAGDGDDPTLEFKVVTVTPELEASVRRAVGEGIAFRLNPVLKPVR